MILSFKTKIGNIPTNFEEKILFGQKIHTIREDAKNRWRVGQIIHFATGVRTKQYNCFKTGVCTGIQTIKIKNDGFILESIHIDGKRLRTLGLMALMDNDGFDCLQSFKSWFNKDFEGKIIHWTDHRY